MEWTQLWTLSSMEWDISNTEKLMEIFFWNYFAVKTHKLRVPLVGSEKLAPCRFLQCFSSVANRILRMSDMYVYWRCIIVKYCWCISVKLYLAITCSITMLDIQFRIIFASTTLKIMETLQRKTKKIKYSSKRTGCLLKWESSLFSFEWNSIVALQIFKILWKTGKNEFLRMF
jgi:hypothetical protein